MQKKIINNNNNNKKKSTSMLLLAYHPPVEVGEPQTAAPDPLPSNSPLRTW
jgi:hypothetical protein